MFDAVAVAIPLFHTFGRIGCFLGGCCYGVACDVGFTVHGNTLYPALNDVNRLPIQLIESGLNLILFFVLLVLYKKKKFDGQVFLMYITWYGFGRMFIEGLRTDSLMVGTFRISQVVAFLCFVIGSICIVYLSIRAKKQSKMLAADGEVSTYGEMLKEEKEVSEESKEEENNVGNTD